MICDKKTGIMTGSNICKAAINPAVSAKPSTRDRIADLSGVYTAKLEIT